MLVQYFKNALKTTNESFIIVIPMVVFYILLNLYLILTGSQLNTNVKLLTAFLTITFMTAVFLSGWFFMISRAVKLSKKIFVLAEDAAKAHLALLKDFPTGVGKFFLSYLGQILLAVSLFMLLTFLYFQTGTKLIGDIFTPEQITYLMSPSPDINELINQLTPDQNILIVKWGFLFLGFSFFTSYIIMFWAPEIIYSTTNPLIAFIIAIKKLFKKPLKSFGFFVIINILNFLLSLLVTLTVKILFLYYFLSVFYLYFIVYVVVLIFSYYEGEFINESEEED